MDGLMTVPEELPEKDLLRIVHSVLEVLLSRDGHTTDLGNVFNVDTYSDMDGKGIRAELVFNYNPDEMRGSIQVGYHVDSKTGAEYRDFRIEFQVVNFKIEGLERFLKK